MPQQSTRPFDLVLVCGILRLNEHVARLAAGRSGHLVGVHGPAVRHVCGLIQRQTTWAWTPAVLLTQVSGVPGHVFFGPLRLPCGDGADQPSLLVVVVPRDLPRLAAEQPTPRNAEGMGKRQLLVELRRIPEAADEEGTSCFTRFRRNTC